MGEASISLADLCFPGENLGGSRGRAKFDVMYIAFKGDRAVPGKDGAKWEARSAEEFEESIRELEDSLVAGLEE